MNNFRYKFKYSINLKLITKYLKYEVIYYI